MVKGTKGFRRETRRKLSRGLRDKFKPENYIRQFSPGQSVVIKLDPYSHKGMPFPKFKGKIGKIIEKRGSAYVLKIRVGNSEKTIISSPEHIRPVGK